MNINEVKAVAFTFGVTNNKIINGVKVFPDEVLRKESNFDERKKECLNETVDIDENFYISSPQNVEHIVHVEFDSVNSEFKGFPAAWNDLLRRCNNTRLEHFSVSYKSNSFVWKNLENMEAEEQERSVDLIKHLTISHPINAVHNVHIGFNQTIGEFTGMPEVWAELLRGSKLSKLEQLTLGRVYSNPDSKKNKDLKQLNRSTNTVGKLIISHPTNAEHKVHIGFNHVVGEFTGMPEAWAKHLKRTNMSKLEHLALGQSSPSDNPVRKNNSDNKRQRQFKTLDKTDISFPTNFKHITHIGFNSIETDSTIS